MYGPSDDRVILRELHAQALIFLWGTREGKLILVPDRKCEALVYPIFGGTVHA